MANAQKNQLKVSKKVSLKADVLVCKVTINEKFSRN